MSDEWGREWVGDLHPKMMAGPTVNPFFRREHHRVCAGDQSVPRVAYGAMRRTGGEAAGAAAGHIGLAVPRWASAARSRAS